MALNLSGRVGRAAAVVPKIYRGQQGRGWLATRANLQPQAADLFPGNPAGDVAKRREAGVVNTGHNKSVTGAT